jgi:hypothetical protein
MIVYGDCQEQVSLAAAWRAVVVRLAGLGALPAVDELRGPLIAAGQLQQAVEDALPSSRAAQRTRELTAALARSFFAAWAREQGRAPPYPYDTHSAAARLQALVADAAPASELPVRVKTPEGFAFYALYPEQYLGAAMRWLERGVDPGEHVWVIGLRSIGTTLAALVGAALLAHGQRVDTLTVRPFGDPFARVVELPFIPRAVDWAIIVDEGPGLSGSSLASVATALSSAGVVPKRMCLFPGHDGGPGAAASAEVHRIWSELPRCVVATTAPIHAGRTLTQALAASFQASTGRQVVALTDVPSVPLVRRFARPKYLVVTPDARFVAGYYGTSSTSQLRSTLSELARDRLRVRSSAGFSSAPLELGRGFLALPWYDGKPGAPSVAQLARYIVAVATTPLSPDEQKQSAARLTRLIVTNVSALLGSCDLERTLAGLALASPSAGFGDGNHAAEHWLAAGAAFHKLGSPLRDRDHLAVGRQPIAWDVASALCELELPAAQGDELRRSIGHTLRQAFDREALRPYLVAYRSLRAAALELCIAATTEEHERVELRAARDRQVEGLRAVV